MKETMSVLDKHLFPTIVLALFAFACAPATQGQPPTTAQQDGATDQPPILQPPRLSDVKENLRERVNQSTLTDEEKTAILGTLSQAETQTKETETKRALIGDYQEALASVGKRIEALNSQREELAETETTQITSNELTELEPLLVQAQQQLASTKTALAEAETIASEALGRESEIKAEISKLEAKIAEQTIQIDTGKATPDDSLAGEAARLELGTALQLNRTQLELLKSESALIAAQIAGGFYQAKRDVVALQVEAAEQQTTAIQKTVEELRTKDAANRVEVAESQIAWLHPILQPIGQQNRELAKANQSLNPKIENQKRILAQRKATLNDLQGKLQLAKTNVKNVGLTDAVGAMLRNLKQNLPRTSLFRQLTRERQPLINDTQFELLDLNQRRSAKVENSVNSLIVNSTTKIDPNERESLREQAKELFLTQRKEFLDPAIRNQSDYFNKLVENSTTEQQIVQLTEEASDYIDGLVLWIRSTKPIQTRLIPEPEERWFLSSSAWVNLLPRLVSDFLGQLAIWCAAAFALMILIRYRLQLRTEIAELGTKALKSSSTQFSPTIKSLVMTIATVAPLPLVFIFLSSRLNHIAGSDRTILALGEATRTFAYAYFPIEFLRQVYRKGGLAEAHFGWSINLASMLRRSLRVLLVVFVPLLMLGSFLSAGGLDYGRDTLERYCFLGAMAVLAFVVFQIMHPERGFISDYLRTHPDGWADQLSYAWFPFVIVIPLALAGLSASGYHFTSTELASRFAKSVVWLMGIAVVGALISRWAMIQRRRLMIEQSRNRVEEQTLVGDVPIEPQVPTAESIRSQMHQTRRMLQTIMLTLAVVIIWGIWHDVFTARGFLEKWPLWTSTTSVSEIVTAADGNPVTRTREVLQPITIVDLGLAAIILTLTFLATRNIPGMLEFAVLRQLPFDPSTRYAITTLSTYAIVLAGLIAAGQSIGLRWNQIQWMATALTFGLAFGLQEMFANFIAGIIILFERPVRVGDVVEIDGVTGVVTKIRIRATTITDWNRKDYIVPNKEFITGKLLNWTRSDDVTRIVLTVGVAYGSDTEVAKRLLLQVAKENENVMEEPEPSAVFDGFGDNTLNFTFRVFVARTNQRLDTTHQLHTAIDQAFRKAGIEISFPQRDLHIRSVDSSILDQLAKPS